MNHRALALTGALLLCPAVASASPWTLPRGTAVFGTSYSFQTARQEFFEERVARNFPLNGRYTGHNFTFGVRAGITDRLELELQVPIRSVIYDSDPVLLLPRPTDSPLTDFQWSQRNIIALARSTSGVGDISVAARYRLLLNPVAIAAELRLKLPTGYAGPSGTFGAQPTSRMDFLANAGRYVAPNNVRDDVTLGDAQVDLTPTMLFGMSFPSRTFVRLDVGYNVRFGAAAHQFQSALRFGQLFGEVLFYGWAQLTYAVTSGDLIGVSVAAIDPDLPASQYGGVNNLLLRELRLERDALDLGAGVIFRLAPQVEMNVGYARTIWGRNTSATDSFNVGLAVRADLLRRAATP